MRAKTITEKEFLAQIKALAKLHGWRVYHTHDSRRSDPGFPDLVLVRRGRLIFAELKVGKNKMTLPQVDWLADLGLVGGRVETYCWHPNDWAAIEKILAGEAIP